MGTNYYAIPMVTDDVKHQIRIALEKNEYEKARDLMPPKIHIGKSSGGWQFLFNHNNGEYFGKNRQSIELFLSRCILYNEYGDIYPYDKFWEMVEAKKEGQPETTYGNVSDGLCFSNHSEFS